MEETELPMPDLSSQVRQTVQIRAYSDYERNDHSKVYLVKEFLYEDGKIIRIKTLRAFI